MPNRQNVNVKTEEEMVAQLKLLLDNGYNVAICKNDTLLGCVNYSFVYEEQKMEQI